MHAQKDKGLRLTLKTASDDENLIWSGSLFRSLGAATEKALSSEVIRAVTQCWQNDESQPFRNSFSESPSLKEVSQHFRIS